MPYGFLIICNVKNLYCIARLYYLVLPVSRLVVRALTGDFPLTTRASFRQWRPGRGIVSRCCGQDAVEPWGVRERACTCADRWGLVWGRGTGAIGQWGSSTPYAPPLLQSAFPSAKTSAILHRMHSIHLQPPLQPASMTQLHRGAPQCIRPPLAHTDPAFGPHTTLHPISSQAHCCLVP